MSVPVIVLILAALFCLMVFRFSEKTFESVSDERMRGVLEIVCAVVLIEFIAKAVLWVAGWVIAISRALA